MAYGLSANKSTLNADALPVSKLDVKLDKFGDTISRYQYCSSPSSFNLGYTFKILFKEFPYHKSV